MSEDGTIREVALMVNGVRVGLPQWRGRAESDVDTLRAEITDWVTSTALRDLVECFGQRWPTGDIGAVLTGLEEISARHWDFRRGRERAAAVPTEFSVEVTARVVAAAAALGLRHRDLPDGRAYDHVLIHGGLLRGCLARAGHAAGLLDGSIDSPEVCGLGSFRPLTAPERAMAVEWALGECGDEFDAMDIAVRASFPDAVRGGDSGAMVADRPQDSCRTREYRTPGGTRIRVLAAPSSDPGRRANTADTCTFWAESVGRLGPGQRVLLVTTEHFVPFQHADAIRVLGIPYGCAVETIGVDPAGMMNGRPGPALTAAHYLQEVRSAIRSMRLLVAGL
ncbi:hypothetical protein [Micromonospora yangpuensis]|nr:hypothetical protein [Micromonospora yangpuensis]GGM06643.1 hypothetical protein GCM10012279_25700 [Micromonospora yangpuensis]